MQRSNGEHGAGYRRCDRLDVWLIVNSTAMIVSQLAPKGADAMLMFDCARSGSLLCDFAWYPLGTFLLKADA